MLRHYHDDLGASIFTWCVMEMPGIRGIMDHIVGAGMYDHRPVSVMTEKDLCIVSSPVDEGWLAGLKSQGFGPARDGVIVLEGEGPLPQRMILRKDELTDRLHGMQILHPFHSSQTTVRAAQMFGLEHMGPAPELARDVGDKSYFLERFKEHASPGVSIEQTKSVDLMASQLRDAYDLLADRSPHGRLFVRGASGATGSSVYRVSREHIGEKAHELVRDTEMPRFRVEPEYSLKSSPSVIFRLDSEGAHRLSPVSGQVLEGAEFLGNFYPSNISPQVERRIIDSSMSISRSLWEMGFRGELGYDWIVTSDNETFVAECNARVTGQTTLAAMYGEMIERHGMIAATSFYVQTTMRKYADLEQALGEHFYSGSLPGVAVVNFGPFRETGKAGLQVFAKDPEELRRVSFSLSERLDKGVQPYLESQLCPRAEEPLR